MPAGLWRGLGVSQIFCRAASPGSTDSYPGGLAGICHSRFQDPAGNCPERSVKIRVYSLSAPRWMSIRYSKLAVTKVIEMMEDWANLICFSITIDSSTGSDHNSNFLKEWATSPCFLILCYYNHSKAISFLGESFISYGSYLYALRIWSEQGVLRKNASCPVASSSSRLKTVPHYSVWGYFRKKISWIAVSTARC